MWFSLTAALISLGMPVAVYFFHIRKCENCGRVFGHKR